ncbi:uncharacterized protein BO66DRAFT_26457 [Aspergillus aculeatinus CBS 121060]|uniref:Uncharacterized protein n=1 Tax=Aspergillus aculeatinus CBS 121060 TaxID=1448322 RepID=A0ACD1HG70_9EURO|nr:hypothetical protein BO66DRAFT_26457 [Aspergillus aculeatinus CBS 121060]RAH72589.1 hypothetical protein BO66DRAFT_26457 [Aspergillus aculeatinus CBS 121060]
MPVAGATKEPPKQKSVIPSLSPTTSISVWASLVLPLALRCFLLCLHPLSYCEQASANTVGSAHQASICAHIHLAHCIPTIGLLSRFWYPSIPYTSQSGSGD